MPGLARSLTSSFLSDLVDAGFQVSISQELVELHLCPIEFQLGFVAHIYSPVYLWLAPFPILHVSRSSSASFDGVLPLFGDCCDQDERAWWHRNTARFHHPTKSRSHEKQFSSRTTSTHMKGPSSFVKVPHARCFGKLIYQDPLSDASTVLTTPRLCTIRKYLTLQGSIYPGQAAEACFRFVDFQSLRLNIRPVSSLVISDPC